VTFSRRYRYVGPAAIRDQAVAVDVVAARSAELLTAWLANVNAESSANP
jgi:hypothetical protein